jgi:hypothetical protein
MFYGAIEGRKVHWGYPAQARAESGLRTFYVQNVVGNVHWPAPRGSALTIRASRSTMGTNVVVHDIVLHRVGGCQSPCCASLGHLLGSRCAHRP